MRQRAILGSGAYGRAALPLLAVALTGLAGCGPRRPVEAPAPASFSVEIRALLDAERPTPEFYAALERLNALGPEVDAVLVSMARDPRARTVARSNALVMLAERRSVAALPALRRALLTEEIPALRVSAVLGLQRLAPESEAARNLIRAAVTDPNRSVRLNALLALDTRDVGTLRSVIAFETDREVRQVAMQLVSLAENRGAPLALDRRGALRTTGSDEDPHIVFRPTTVDSVGGLATGDLRVEVPNGTDVVLTPAAEVVQGVVPAFFSPDRARVVFEAEREIRVVDLSTRTIRSFGPGIAPRLVPFTDEFVFVREKPDARREAPRGTEIRYALLRASFDAEEAVEVGEMVAVASMENHANYSPVRWMAVGEIPQGFVLYGDGIPMLLIPAAPAADATPAARRREPIR